MREESKLSWQIQRSSRNFIGQRFSTLVVTGYSHTTSSATYWFCKCDCGREVVIARTNITNKRLRSCGCLQITRGKHNKNWRGRGDIPASWFSRVKAQARRRKIDFFITIDYVYDLLCNQNKKCALSGLELTFPEQYRNRGMEEYTASLDRIDSDKGYVVGNVQWLHKDINFMKQKMSQDEFVRMCTLVHKHSVLM